jgi:stage II sporulation protein M
MKVQKKKNSFKKIVTQHIGNNLKEYLIVTIIFFIGIILGVIFINHTTQEQQIEISDYLNQFITALKGDYTIDQGKLLITSMKDNLILAITLWFVGSTVIGIPIVLGIITFRGFSLGYTISSAIAILGTGKGMLFSFTSLLFQNILFIPAILALGVSGMKLYQSIMKDKRKENIKQEIARHTIFSLIMLAILCLSSLTQVYVSTNLLMLCIGYI